MERTVKRPGGCLGLTTENVLHLERWQAVSGLRHLPDHDRSIRLFHAQRPFPHHRKYPLRLEQKGTL